MKLLITENLSERSSWNHVYPITLVDEVDTIVIVRNKSGLDLDKVRYIASSERGVKSPILSLAYKFTQLLKYSIREKPALIHAYMYPIHGYLVFLVGKLTGRKVGVSLIAGPVETYMLGGSPIGKYSYCRPLPPPGLLGKFLLYLLNKYDVITVTGSFTRDFLIRNGVDREKIYIMPHVVDSRFTPVSIEKEFDVIYVGRLAKVKHVETLIRATAIIKESHPSIRVAIVGNGEEEAALKELAQSLDLQDQIHFAGFQDNTWEWYNRSRLSVLTSEREGFPYSVVESMKCGVPVIVSNCGDVCDIVRDSDNGMIINDCLNDVTYANTIVELLRDPCRIEKLSKNCIEMMKVPISPTPEQEWSNIVRNVNSADYGHTLDLSAQPNR